MKRRGFLQLLGGALVVPALPAAPLGAASRAAYPAAALQAALAQAKGQLNFSVFALAQKFGLQFDQAEQLMSDLSKQGILGPLQGTTQVGRWARSQVWQRPVPPLAVTKPLTKKNSDVGTTKRAVHDRQARVDADQVETSKDISKLPKDIEKEQKMDKWEDVSGVAAPMPLVNIDTDMIIPKQFLKTIKRSGLGVNLFDEMRYDDNGEEIADFVLNKPAYRNAEIIVAGDNFGCGSSREHAPWALKDFGVKVVISTSFADIFYNNCFKNGILPVVLPKEAVDVLMEDAERGENARISVNLEDQTVSATDGTVFSYEVDEFKKHCLLNGLDDIGLTMQKEAAIDTFEKKHEAAAPWL